MNLTFVGDFKPDFSHPQLGFLSNKRLVANLECAVSNSSHATAEKAHPVIYKPEAVLGLANYPLAVISVANNHVGDAGPEGLSEIRSLLAHLDGIAVTGTRDEPIAFIEIAGLRCAIIGSLEKCRARPREISREEDVEGLIRSVRRDVDRIFVTPHWGKEGEYSLHYSPNQRELARKWINAGADGIFGHHSHTVHGMEWICNKPVFYSLGNFLFDHEESRQHPLTRIGLAVEWNPLDPDGREWLLHPMLSVSGSIQPLEGDARHDWLKLFNELSHWPSDGGAIANWIRWNRAVGRVYIPKSDRSWKKRLLTRNFKTRLLWLAWSLLPATLALRAGARVPDRASVELEQQLLKLISLVDA